MTLPPPIDSYFSATNAHDANALAACFSSDAVVLDNGEREEIHGTEAIREWSRKVNEQYKLSAEVLGAEQAGKRTLVTANVSGDFPGSPLQFKYYFTLKGGIISALEIKL